MGAVWFPLGRPEYPGRLNTPLGFASDEANGVGVFLVDAEHAPHGFDSPSHDPVPDDVGKESWRLKESSVGHEAFGLQEHYRIGVSVPDLETRFFE